MKFKSALLILLASATLAGCGGVDPNSPLGQRQAIFKQMLKTSEDLGGMIRGRIVFDEARFTEGAAKLDKISRTPWQHFPQVKEEDHTNAKDDVWKRQARFKQLTEELEASTAALVVATTEKPLEASALAAPVKRVEDSCKACHEEFRNH